VNASCCTVRSQLRNRRTHLFDTTCWQVSLSLIIFRCTDALSTVVRARTFIRISRVWLLLLLSSAGYWLCCFHFASPWWFTEIASHWTNIDFTINLTFWVTGTVFVLVNLFLAYSVYRYRQRKGAG
jgi:hypothetical protein